MALQNESWFIHQVSDNVTHLSQQRRSKTSGTTRVQEGVVGKTWPFNILGTFGMEEMLVRDGDTVYANPDQTKRRAVLRDFGLAVLIDDFDKIKELANAKSEFAISMAYARNRTMDDLILAIPGLGAAGATGTGNGGAIGNAATVNEGAETASTSPLPTTQQIVNGGTGLTMTKVRSARSLLMTADAPEEDNYFFASPIGISKLLTDETVTSADYSTIHALSSGTFPQDAMWMGFKWRVSTRLPKSGNIRSCIAYQKSGVGWAASSIESLEMGKDPGKWNNDFVMAKMSGGAVRIDDNLVVQIDIDETA